MSQQHNIHCGLATAKGKWPDLCTSCQKMQLVLTGQQRGWEVGEGNGADVGLGGMDLGRKEAILATAVLPISYPFLDPPTLVNTNECQLQCSLSQWDTPGPDTPPKDIAYVLLGQLPRDTRCCDFLCMLEVQVPRHYYWGTYNLHTGEWKWEHTWRTIPSGYHTLVMAFVVVVVYVRPFKCFVPFY